MDREFSRRQFLCLFKFGGWNECPAPEIQVAICKQWYEQFGAELAVMTGSTVEFSVSRPPQTREAALTLAEEQYIYCPDIVEQGLSSIEALAAAILGSKIWYFWWD